MIESELTIATKERVTQKKVSFAAQQQPVVLLLLLLVASLTSWKTITFWRSHPSRERICSSMRKVQIAWSSPALSGTWSGSPGCSSTTANAEDPSGTGTHRECYCPLRCGGEPKNWKFTCRSAKPSWVLSGQQWGILQPDFWEGIWTATLFFFFYPSYLTDINWSNYFGFSSKCGCGYLFWHFPLPFWAQYLFWSTQSYLGFDGHLRLITLPRVPEEMAAFDCANL